MNCRNCGAAMQPVGGRVYFRCNHCGTFEFPATQGDGIASLGESSEVPCPVCKSNLGHGAVEGHKVLCCVNCRGFLAQNEVFGDVVNRKRSAYADQPVVTKPFDSKELQRRLACPQCRKMMDTHAYGGGGNTVVDTCYRCKLIWLDASELETIARYRSGKSQPLPTPIAPIQNSRPPESNWTFGGAENVMTLTIDSWLDAIIG